MSISTAPTLLHSGWAQRLRLNLGTRLALSIALVIGVTSLILFVGIYRLQEQHVNNQLETQAQALLTEMVGVREWVALNGGVWTENPGAYYWNNRDGFYRKTPAMVTKELSTLLNARSDFRFHITSLRLKNPANAPDEFERDALHGFEEHAEPINRIEWVENGLVFRRMIPLKAERACLDCHSDQGYQVGDIRGGLSVLVPMASATTSLADNRNALIFSALVMTTFVVGGLYVLARRLIVAPVTQLQAVALAVGRGDYAARSRLQTGDELETLGNALNQMIAGLETSRAELQERVTRRTHELHAISKVALTVSRAGTLDDILNAALEIVLHDTGARGGVIHLTERARWQRRAWRGLNHTMLAWFDTPKSKERFLEHVLTTGQTFALADLVGANSAVPDDLAQLAAQQGFHSLICLPLHSHNQTLGTLTLWHAQPNGFTPEAIQLLNCIGDQLGVAVENARLRDRAAQAATTEERARIARELHDSLAQALGYLNLKTDVLQSTLERGDVNESQKQMSDIRRVVQEACYDVRESIDGLRTRLGEGVGLMPTLATYLYDFGQRTGLLTEYVVADNDLGFSPVVETEVLRVVQEALTNVRKHAHAKRVRVVIRNAGAMIELMIEDDGRGFDLTALPPAQHFGLRIMRERIERVGGTLALTSAPGQGTRVLVQLKTPTQEQDG